MPTSTMRLSVVERVVTRRPVSAPQHRHRPLLLLSLLGCALGAAGYVLARLLEPRPGRKEGEGEEAPAAQVHPSPREPRRVKVRAAARGVGAARAPCLQRPQPAPQLPPQVSFASDTRPGCALHLVAGGQAGRLLGARVERAAGGRAEAGHESLASSSHCLARPRRPRPAPPPASRPALPAGGAPAAAGAHAMRAVASTSTRRVVADRSMTVFFMSTRRPPSTPASVAKATVRLAPAGA